MNKPLLYFSLGMNENKKRYSAYKQLSDIEKKTFVKMQVQKTGLLPDQIYSIIMAPAIPISSTVGNKGKRVFLRDLYEEIYKNDIKVISILMNSLSCLDSPFLSDAWGDIDPKTGEMTPLTLRRLATDHIKRILNADLCFPIITLNKKTVLDGWHRVAKACYLGHASIFTFDISEAEWQMVPDMHKHPLK